MSVFPEEPEHPRLLERTVIRSSAAAEAFRATVCYNDINDKTYLRQSEMRERSMLKERIYNKGGIRTRRSRELISRGGGEDQAEPSISAGRIQPERKVFLYMCW